MAGSGFGISGADEQTKDLDLVASGVTFDVSLGHVANDMGAFAKANTRAGATASDRPAAALIGYFA